MAKLCNLFAPVIAVLSVLGPSTVARAQSCQGWTQRTPTSKPSPRYSHAMAYDSARHEAVLFGGGYPELGDTWAWDGSTWTLRATTGPSPRYGHAMAYDSTRGVTVLFGGSNSAFQENGETWEWDGSSWTLRSTSGPSARLGHAMAYDSARHVTVFFGGHTRYDYKNDTWEWDGPTWTRRTAAGPSPSDRTGHAMAYDSARAVTVLFGGITYDYAVDRYVYFNDTWEWNGVTWTLRSQDGPSPRSSHALSYDSARGISVLYGGHWQLGDTWEWDGASWVQRADNVPTMRGLHAMVYDSARGMTVLFGGSAIHALDDTWEWDGGGAAAWTNYGAGWSGTAGIPAFTAGSAPVLCAPITVELENSLGASTLAALFIGLAPTDQPTSYDGHLLAVPSNILLFTLPGAGLSIASTVPCNPVLCGRSIYLQALEVDPGASQGISFTRGVRLVVGS